ncbi:hypothetical protein M3C29_009630 [Micrococcus luteus]|nr:hypothetical protein [Micrococcus luteus]
MALPGLPGHPALRPRSPVLAAVREMLGGPQTSFLLIAGQNNAQADHSLGVTPRTIARKRTPAAHTSAPAVDS